MVRLIKAIIFDYGGVIVKDILDILTEELFKEFKLNKEFIRDNLKKFFKEFQEKKFGEQESLKMLSKIFEVNYEKLEMIWKRVAQDPDRIISEVVDLIKLLKVKHYKIGLLSNAIPYASYDAGIRNLFDDIVISSDVGVRKPSKEIYILVLKRLGVPANETVFIDNRDLNLVPARELGILTILFRNPAQLKSDLIGILQE